MALLLPLHPVRIISRAAGPVFRALADQLRPARRHALQYRERLPDDLAGAVAALADAVDQLHRDVRQTRSHDQTRRIALHAAAQAGCARGAGLETFGAAVATRVRVAASDMLRTTGCSIDAANRRVRLATLGRTHGRRSSP